jgi:PAS domain S-box-containing protein
MPEDGTADARIGAAPPRVARNTSKRKRVAEKREAEDALRESEERFRTVADFTYDWEYWTAPDESFVYVSPSCERMTGYTADEFLHDPDLLRRIVHPDDVAHLADHTHDPSGAAPTEPLDLRIITRSGEERWVSHVCRAVFGADGRPLGRRASNRDITERKHAEAEQQRLLRQAEEARSALLSLLEDRQRIEEGLRQSEAALKQAQRVAHVGSWTWHIPTNRLEWSDEMYRIFGIDKATFTGHLRDVMPRTVAPRDLAAVESAHDAFLSERRRGPVDFRIVQPDGTVRTVWVEAGEVALDGAGAPILVTGIVQDITERKEAEEATRQREEQFRTIFDRSTVGYSLTLPDGRLLRVNTAFAAMLGYSVDELVTMGFAQITYPEDVAESREVIRCLMANEQDSFHFEKRYLHKDGHIVWALVGTTLLRDNAGIPIYFITSIQDITDHKEAEQALRFSEEQFRSLYENASIGMYRTTPCGKIVMANPALMRMLGYDSFDELANRDLASEGYEPTYERRQFQEAIEREGKVHGLEAAWKRRDGSTVYVRESARLVRDASGQAAYYEGTVEDVTEREQAEEAIRRLNAELEQRVHERTAELEVANRELESFAYSISHDLRAPLRHMNGFSGLLTEAYGEQLDAQGRRYLERIRAASQEMSDLIDALLSLSRVTRQDLTRRPVDLSELAREVAANVQAQASGRRAEIVISDEMHGEGDANLLRLVLQNLLSNAWKFTSTRPAARIEVGQVEHDGQCIYYVRDNGVGFDMAYAGKLFAPFQRLHTIEQFPGTGIGLATVQRIVRRHGGRVWTEAVVDQGATFFFTLA